MGGLIWLVTFQTLLRYLDHSKIKFVSPRGHEISSISEVSNVKNLKFFLKSFLKCLLLCMY